MPEDLSVVGFGDFEVGRGGVPPLTTVRVDARPIGREVGRLLLDVLAGDGEASAVGDLGFGLVERQSTRALQAGAGPGRPGGVGPAGLKRQGARPR